MSWLACLASAGRACGQWQGAERQRPPAAAASALAGAQPLAPPADAAHCCPLLLCSGKQQLALFSDKLVVRTAKADLCVPWAAIKHVAVSGGMRTPRCMRSLRARLDACAAWASCAAPLPAASCAALFPACPLCSKLASSPKFRVLLQIMDSIPGDTKGKVLLYLHVDRWGRMPGMREAASRG